MSPTLPQAVIGATISFSYILLGEHLLLLTQRAV